MIKKSLEDNDRTYIFVGSAETINRYNPYSFEIRKHIISTNFPKSSVEIFSLPDFETDELWLKNILHHLPNNVEELTFYC